jgi:hypothetical protein
MKKILLFMMVMSIAIAMSAQCGSNSSRSNNYKKTTTTTTSKKGSTTTYIYSYKKGPTTQVAGKNSSNKKSCSSSKSSCSSSCSSKKSSHKKKNHKRTERLMFAVTGGATYMMDPAPAGGNIPKGDEPTNGLEWNPELLQPIGSAFVGYRFDVKGNKRANVVGAWGTMGSHSAATLTRLFAKQDLLGDANGTQGNQFFTELEGGFLLKEMFRLSGGKGAQNYINLSGENVQMNYNVATAGLHIPLSRNISWNTSLSMLFGQDFSQYTLRPTSGISFKFNTLRL